MNWIVETIIIHVLFLGSIFVIYFRSPVIQGLEPQSDLVNPPAKRLVLFVMDGLRADSFFDEDCKHIPHIRDIFLQQGVVGISHTRVPTESRPGHIALIAGLYEDPTAVTKGWQENPIDFDSVFNRSRKTYAWGSNDILSIFSKSDYDKKMEFYAYDHALDFSGKEKSYQLDTWVFSRVRDYIMQNAPRLRSETKVIYFLHLLGLDTAGHVHKPGTPLFLENLKVTDNGIADIYNIFEEHFPDKKTAYVVASDHGMTDKGSHGAGDIFETDTPLVAWGAGLHHWRDLSEKVGNRIKTRRIAGEQVISFDVDQADIAPLMSALVGVAVPVNNYGKLPKELLDVDDDYLMNAMYNNAAQTLAQFEKLYADFKKGAFSNILFNFEKLTGNSMEELKTYVRNKAQNTVQNEAIAKAEELIDFAVEGIEYYQMYYQRFLLFCTSLSFLGWISNLLLMLENHRAKPSYPKINVYGIAVAIGLLLELFVYLQKIPQTVGLYFLLPLYCWARVFEKVNIPCMKRTLTENWKVLFAIIIGSELLVFTFFKREIISVAVFGFILYQNSTFKIVRSIDTIRSQYYEWLVTAILLVIFPIIPLGYLKNDLLLRLGGLLWITKLCISVKDLKNTSMLQLLSFTGFANCVTCLYFQNSGEIFSFNLLLSWILSGCALVAPIYSNVDIRSRTASVFFYFAIPFFHLSIGFEMIFFALLGINILSFVELRALVDQYFIAKCVQQHDGKERGSLVEHLNISATMLLLIFLSFFGTGNMASISSFDPIFVRFFVTTFSPFTMMALIIVKLVLPLLLITTAITALTFRNKIDEKKMFLSLLLMCELMGLNFLFMVTNKGSWLEIGTSISHFVIMEVTTLVLAIVNFLSKILLFTDLSKTCQKKRRKLV